MQPTHLNWGIKTSLLAYVATLEDGKVELTAPAVKTDSGFNFTYDASASSPDQMQFRGGVLITGYWGSMRIPINDPQLRINATKVELAIRIDSFTGTTKYEVIAQGDFDESANTCALNLTYAGQMILGQQYQVGQPIDSATIHFG